MTAKRNSLGPFLLFLIISLLLLMADKAGLVKPIRSLTESVTSPVEAKIYQTRQSFGQFFSLFGRLDEKQKRINQLEGEVVKLQELTLKAQSLEEENLALRKQLQAPLPSSTKYLPAKTLSLERSLKIDKGEEDGIKIGANVVVENILVGKVMEVLPKMALVMLVTDPEMKIPAKTLKTQARGLVNGDFGTKAIFDKVLQSEALELNDLVITTGESGFAKDLLIGQIVNVTKKEVEPFQKAELKSSLDYQKLENVFVLL